MADSINNSVVNFDVTAFNIDRITNVKIPAMNQNYVLAHFRFSREWVRLSKTVIFFREDIGAVQVPLIDNQCQIPNETLMMPGVVFVSVFAGDFRTTNTAQLEVIESGYKDGYPPIEPPNPTNVYVQTPGNSTPFIREAFGNFEYFANGIWNTVKQDDGGSRPADVYHGMFSVNDWEPYATNARFTVSAAQHEHGLYASILEVLRNGIDFAENILYTSRRYPNGDISLISNLPFSGQIAII